MRERVLAWLGEWRDGLPPEAVRALQDICAPTPEREASPVAAWAVEIDGEIEELHHIRPKLSPEDGVRVVPLVRAARQPEASPEEEHGEKRTVQPSHRTGRFSREEAREAARKAGENNDPKNRRTP